MALRDDLLRIEPETSGAISADRFDYQKNWAICKIIDLHKNSNDYAVVFEYFDDIAVLNSSVDPSNISYFQVKTRSRHITVGQLVERKEGAKSILGKLYHHRITLSGDYIESLNVVSNADYSVKLRNPAERSIGLSEICCANLHADEITKIKASIKKEHGLFDDPILEDITYLLVSDLTTTHQTELTRDKLSLLIKTLYPEAKYDPILVYQVVFDTVKKKNKPAKYDRFDELIRHKSITWEEFDMMLSVIAQPDKFKEKGDRIHDVLVMQSASVDILMTFKENWERLRVEMISGTLLFLEMERAIRGVVRKLEPHEKKGTYLECTEVVLKRLKALKPSYNLYADALLSTMILSELFGE